MSARDSYGDQLSAGQYMMVPDGNNDQSRRVDKQTLREELQRKLQGWLQGCIVAVY